MLIIIQFALFAYLLALDVRTILLFTLLLGVPTALTGYYFLEGKVKRYAKMSLVMVATGGFGMLLGCVIDLGQVGVYGLLSMCQTYSIFEWGIDSFWQKFKLTPWTYVGMFLCGNLGMLYFDNLHTRRTISFLKVFYIYAICNIGMLLGMLFVESAVAIFIPYLNQFLAAGLMIVSMLMGMVLGMILLMILVNKLTKGTLIPVSFTYSDCIYDTVN